MDTNKVGAGVPGWAGATVAAGTAVADCTDGDGLPTDCSAAGAWGGSIFVNSAHQYLNQRRIFISRARIVINNSSDATTKDDIPEH